MFQIMPLKWRRKSKIFSCAFKYCLSTCKPPSTKKLNLIVPRQYWQKTTKKFYHQNVIPHPSYRKNSRKNKRDCALNSHRCLWKGISKVKLPMPLMKIFNAVHFNKQTTTLKLNYVFQAWTTLHLSLKHN